MDVSTVIIGYITGVLAVAQGLWSIRKHHYSLGLFGELRGNKAVAAGWLALIFGMAMLALTTYGVMNQGDSFSGN